MIGKCSRFFLVIFVLTFSFIYPSPAVAEAPEVKKEQLVGGVWYFKKNFYIIKEDGTYVRQIRLRKKKVITSCTGKFKITGNHVEFEGFCPNSRDKFRWEIISIEANAIKAVHVSFGVQLPEEGVRAERAFKRLKK